MAEFECWRDGNRRIVQATDNLTFADLTHAHDQWAKLRAWLDRQHTMPYVVAAGVFAAFNYRCEESKAVAYSRGWFKFPRMYPVCEQKSLLRAIKVSSGEEVGKVLSRAQYCLYMNLVSPELPMVVVNPMMYSIWQGELTAIGQGDIKYAEYEMIMRSVVERTEILSRKPEIGVRLDACDLQRALCAKAEQTLGHAQMELGLE